MFQASAAPVGNGQHGTEVSAELGHGGGSSIYKPCVPRQCGGCLSFRVPWCSMGKGCGRTLCASKGNWSGTVGVCFRIWAAVRWVRRAAPGCQRSSAFSWNLYLSWYLALCWQQKLLISKKCLIVLSWWSISIGGTVPSSVFLIV